MRQNAVAIRMDMVAFLRARAGIDENAARRFRAEIHADHIGIGHDLTPPGDCWQIWCEHNSGAWDLAIG
ncbi:hypothetical protein D3C71_1841890 [compost metagenome]